MTTAVEPLSDTQVNSIKSSINQRAKELDDAFTNVLIHSAPVLQSADLLKKAIDEIVGSIESDQFEHAADLGYEDLSSNFIWMQRALGSLKDAAMQCSEAIAQVAGDCGLAHEQVKPLVVEYFEGVRGPRGKQLTEEEQKKRRDELLANLFVRDRKALGEDQL